MRHLTIRQHTDPMNGGGYRSKITLDGSVVFEGETTTMQEKDFERALAQDFAARLQSLLEDAE